MLQYVTVYQNPEAVQRPQIQGLHPEALKFRPEEAVLPGKIGVCYMYLSLCSFQWNYLSVSVSKGSGFVRILKEH